MRAGRGGRWWGGEDEGWADWGGRVEVPGEIISGASGVFGADTVAGVGLG